MVSSRNIKEKERAQFRGKNAMSLDEFLKDIYRMPDPDWFSNRWGQIVKEWKKKADDYDRYVKHIASLEEYGVWGSINRLDDKIETIKKLTEPFIEWGGPNDAFYRVRLHKHPEMQEYVNELMKVLYPDDQSSGETPT